LSTLLNVDEAVAQILRGIGLLPAESVPLADSLGRVLAVDIRSEINLPPFANSSMDGYAVRAEDVAGAAKDKPAILRVVMDIPAGATPKVVLQNGEAARIMTGAPLPDGANAVVPVEETDSQFNAAGNDPLPAQVVVYKGSKTGDYVRPIGEDIRAGQIVLAAGTTLRPQEIGVLAALGCATVSVIRKPRVAIISTGDELVEVGEPLAPGKIRDSNGYTIAALVTSYGGQPVRLPVARDTLDDVRRAFHDALDSQPDIILSSAGVSVGAFDVVRTVLAELGEVNFWRVNLRPGKPLAFGHLRGVPFFGLPGNPVSAMVTFDVFVRPVLLKMNGQPDAWPTAKALAGEDIPSDGRRSYIRVKLARENGHFVATTTGTQSSGALTSMVLADGLLIIPEGVKHVPAGMELEVRLLKSLY
jgi:molybdopterin molybdotransferase